MRYIDKQLKQFKNLIENAIKDNGANGKESIIRSSDLINLIHDAIKYELIQNGVDELNIFPQLNKTKPEIKLAGFLKQKDQDVCVVPKNIKPKKTIIDWGPLAFENKIDEYGYEYSTNTLIINVRSQMSSLSKNSDTLFERTFAEALNLHMRYKNAVLGEVYLIPTHEYDDIFVKEKKVVFKSRPTNLEKYISFFNSINNRITDGDDYEYERCTLLIVDFSKEIPKLYSNSDELKKDGLISEKFSIEYDTLSFETFIDDILKIYADRYDINNLLVAEKSDDYNF